MTGQDSDTKNSRGVELVWAITDNPWGRGSRIVILRRDTYEDLSRRFVAFECSTWGELRARLDPDVYREVCELAGYESFEGYTKYLAITGTAPLPNAETVAREHFDPDAELPDDDQSFDAYSDIGACADGDWPPAVAYLMNNELPDAILDRYADTFMTNFNGEFAVIDAKHQEEVLQDLRDLGFVVTEEPGLIPFAENG